MLRQFRIKICGITNSEDAVAAVSAGADAIGLNFFERSQRYIRPDTALEIMFDGLQDVAVIGVFVNHPVSDMMGIADHLQLAAIQLHGDETPEILEQLENSNVIRAVRIGDDSEASVVAVQHEIDAWCEKGVAGILLDKAVGTAYGGTGESFDWSILERIEIPVMTILAGGLTPGNVASAIQIVGPDAVDTASGIEKSPGQKDVELMKKFIRSAGKAMSDMR